LLAYIQELRTGREPDNKKALIPLNSEGTRARFLFAPVVPPRLSSVLQRSPSSSLHCDEGLVTTLTGYLCCMGTTHLFLLALIGFLRSAAHERVLRRRIRSELPPDIGSLLVAVSRTMFAPRGSDFI